MDASLRSLERLGECPTCGAPAGMPCESRRQPSKRHWSDRRITSRTTPDDDNLAARTTKRPHAGRPVLS